MSVLNTHRTPANDVTPQCDDCGDACERGYSLIYKDKTVNAVRCIPCSDRRDLVDFLKSGRLHSHFMTTTAVKCAIAERDGDIPTLDKYEKALHAVKSVEFATKGFCNLVWPEVRRQVNAERKYKGMRVDRDGLTVLAFAMCGRIRIQVECGESWVSGQGLEDEAYHGFGLHGINATADEAVKLWQDATALFESGAQLVADPNVGI